MNRTRIHLTFGEYQLGQHFGNTFFEILKYEPFFSTSIKNFHPILLTTKKCRNSEKMLLPAFKCWVQSKSFPNFGHFHIRCFFFGQILKIFTRVKDPSFFPVLCIINRKCCKNEFFFVVDLFYPLQYYCHPSKSNKIFKFRGKKRRIFPLSLNNSKKAFLTWRGKAKAKKHFTKE